jgi:hypothetical protein
MWSERDATLMVLTPTDVVFSANNYPHPVLGAVPLSLSPPVSSREHQVLRNLLCQLCAPTARSEHQPMLKLHVYKRGTGKTDLNLRFATAAPHLPLPPFKIRLKQQNDLTQHLRSTRR